ncbi:MAG: hypothetical protein J0I10_23120, partial [Verrucomicrobia bacterium]|nr:hypothetical protein [Verrucomicrobiota bacterium]
MLFGDFLRFQFVAWPIFLLFIFPAKLKAEGDFLWALESLGTHDSISIILSFWLGAIYPRFYRNHYAIIYFGGIVALCVA